jgi:putative nucleotidyltransferase with HDIG domain
MDELASPDATTDSVGDLISQDVSLTAKILQLVNSAFFGVAQPVSSAREAVQILGFSLVRTLALSIYVFSRFDPVKMPDFPVERLWRHSFATGMLAHRIATREKAAPESVEVAFTAGILHDIGKVTLSYSLPQLHRKAMERAAEEKIPSHEAELAVIGAGHPEVGAFLLGLWGLPAELVSAVECHHRPKLRGVEGFCATAAVHIAEYIQTARTPVWNPPLVASVDMEYVRALGLEETLRAFEDDGVD